MGYFGDVWNNLVFNSANATTQYVQSQNWRLKNVTGDVDFRSQAAYKSVLVHIAKQLAMSTLEHELNDLLPKYKRYARDKMRDAVREQQDKNYSILIENGKKKFDGYGRVWLSDKDGNPEKYELLAKTKFGRPVPEALILSFEGDKEWSYTDIKATGLTVDPTTGEAEWDDNAFGYSSPEKQTTLEKIWNPTPSPKANSGHIQSTDPIFTRTVFHIDLAPNVSMSSTKNVVLTQVQGRDFSRKELVSGGDLTFSVSGNIVSNDFGVYPTEAVKRFVQIMQFGGIVNVNFVTFGILGVKRIIIKDWSLGQVEYKNMQPYTFSCVAVEPDDAIKLQEDTITAINNQLAESMWDTWYKAILENKLVEMGVQTALNAATSAITSSAGAGLDALLPNQI